jgi:hypothetical protein
MTLTQSHLPIREETDPFTTQTIPHRPVSPAAPAPPDEAPPPALPFAADSALSSTKAPVVAATEAPRVLETQLSPVRSPTVRTTKPQLTPPPALDVAEASLPKREKDAQKSPNIAKGTTTSLFWSIVAEQVNDVHLDAHRGSLLVTTPAHLLCAASSGAPFDITPHAVESSALLQRATCFDHSGRFLQLSWLPILGRLQLDRFDRQLPFADRIWEPVWQKELDRDVFAPPQIHTQQRSICCIFQQSVTLQYNDMYGPSSDLERRHSLIASDD